MMVIKNGEVLTENGFVRQDILIGHNKIVKIASDIREQEADYVDAKDCLVLPGLVNAHIHSHDNFNKGGFENMPLELWMIYNRPFYTGIRHTEEEIYIRTLIGCAEMIKTGTTCVIDDVMLNGLTDEKSLNAVIRAYRDSGMRAVVTPHTKNLPMQETIPYLQELFPEKVKQKLGRCSLAETEILGFLESKIKEYNKTDARITIGLSDSAPQRCTQKLMLGMRELSEKYGVVCVTHVLETYVQKKTGEVFYGKSLIKHMAENDLLYPNRALAHTIWIDEEDMDLIAASGCKTIHNPGCNLKMGSGIAPVKKLRDRGITVGLGTDNISANDSVNMFEMMKLCGLISKITTPDYEQWLSESDIFEMATTGGGGCTVNSRDIGVIEEGSYADIVIAETLNERLASSYEWKKGPVYAENGASIKDVIIDGKMILKDRKLTTMDEKRLYKDVRKIISSMVKSERELSYLEGKEIYPILQTVYKKANKERGG